MGGKGHNRRILKIMAMYLALGMVAASGQSFTAVVVHAVRTTPGSRHMNDDSDPQHLNVEASPHRLVLMAYGITANQLEREPGWCNSTLYSVRAVTARPTTHQQKMLMLRAVLADQFSLKMRQEKRSASVYELKVAPGRAKFKPLPAGTGASSHSDISGDLLRAKYTRISGLVQTLNDSYGGRLRLDRPVVDATHLTGAYAISLRTKLVIAPGSAGDATFTFPDLFRDLRSELGLELVRGQARQTYFIVEQATRPPAE
jgi:uncharacterized protein (TIGR03435 family)